jgi:serine/threonine protein kinase
MAVSTDFYGIFKRVAFSFQHLTQWPRQLHCDWGGDAKSAVLTGVTTFFKILSSWLKGNTVRVVVLKRHTADATVLPSLCNQSSTMQTALCPSSETLKDLLLGNLSRHERESLEEHLLTCNRCVSEAETIVADDDLTALTRAATTLPDDDADALAALIDKIKQARSRAETVGFGETLPGDLPPGSPAAAAETYNLSFLAPAQSEDELGRLGDYRILEVLGAGGMGLVLRAEDTKLRRQVALKTMKAAIAESPTAKVRFTREAQATAALEHDHIVPIYQVGEDRGIPFIAMQYLRGESLHTRLQKLGKLAPAEVVRIGKEVASGLAMAHEHDLTHRDIKPDNIWIETKTNRAKILDFGLVSATAEDEGLTHSGTVLGTPRYMSPEQALGHPVDHRSDLFSLGSVLYHAVTGEPPFAGSNFTSTLIAVAHQPPVPLQSAASELHPEVASIIMQLLEKDPGKRPQTASEVAERFAELEQLLKRVSIPAGNHDQLSDTVSYEHPIKSPKLPPGKPPRRPLLLAGAGGLAALLLGILVITIRDKDGKETTIRVPSGTEIEVDAQPESKVTIREEAGSEPRTTAKTMDPNDEATTDPDRRLAEFVLSREKPGSVVIRRPENPSGEQFTIEDIGQLPSWPFVIVLATVLSNVSDADLARFGTVRNLKRLDLVAENLELTDDGIETLSRTAIIESLISWNVYTAPKLTDACIHSLNRFSKLTHLTFQGNRNITDAGVMTLELPLLKNLDLLWTNISSSALANADARLPMLEYLRLDQVEGDDLAGLTGLSLTELIVHQSYVAPLTLSEEHGKNLGSINTLTTLNLGSQVDDEFIIQLKRLRQLKTLIVAHASELTDRSIVSLGGCLQMQRLVLGGHGELNREITTVEGLSRLPELQSIDIDNVAINDNQLHAFAEIPKLERLSITRCPNVTESGVRYLKQRLPQCVIESDLIDLEAVPHIVDYDAERRAAEWVLSIGGTVSLRDKQDEPLSFEGETLPDLPFVVESVAISGTRFANDDLSKLTKCSRLRRIAVTDLKSQLNKSGISHIAQILSLRQLYFDYNQASTGDFSPLANLKDLEYLGIRAQQIGDHELSFITGLNQLIYISIKIERGPTNECLKYFSDVPNIATLIFDCPNCNFTDADLDALWLRLPELRTVRLPDNGRCTFRTLKSINKLWHVAATASQMSTSGVKDLLECRNIEVLDVHGPFSDEDASRLAALSALPKLRSLVFTPFDPSTVKLGITGAMSLAKLPAIEQVHFYGRFESVGDEALMALVAAPSLKRISELRSEKLTPQGIESVRAARPDVSFFINGTEYPATIQSLDLAE